MAQKIRVGLLGANPDRGWGTSVHVPVIAALPAFVLEAVGTTRQYSAKTSAERFGARLAFCNAWSLISHPDVDLVTISVKAPDHYRLAMMTLTEGKHVYFEWPLAVNLAQAIEMRDLALEKGVKAMVGLQSRGSPVLTHARAMINDGYVGRIVSARMACALPGGGGERSRDGLYVIEKANGAGTMDIQCGHAIDALRFVAGEFSGLSAVVANQFSSVKVIETGEIRAKDAPDQILISGRLQNGAVVSVVINGGVIAGHGIEISIFGTEGTLSISGHGPLNFQMSNLHLHGARTPARKLTTLEPPLSLGCQYIEVGSRARQPYPGVEVPRSTLVNVANLYDRLGEAIFNNVPADPDFTVGVEVHAMLKTIEKSSKLGIYKETVL